MINQAAVITITLPIKIRKNRRVENLIKNFIRAIGCGKPSHQTLLTQRWIGRILIQKVPDD